MLPFASVFMLRKEAREKYNIEVRPYGRMRSIAFKDIISGCCREATWMIVWPLSAAARASLARQRRRSRRGETTSRDEGLEA